MQKVHTCISATYFKKTSAIGGSTACARICLPIKGLYRHDYNFLFHHSMIHLLVERAQWLSSSLFFLHVNGIV